MTIEEMAKAHLENVKKALNDLLVQRQRIHEEIEKINEYLKQGEALVLDSQHVNQAVSTDN